MTETIESMPTPTDQLQPRPWWNRPARKAVELIGPGGLPTGSPRLTWRCARRYSEFSVPDAVRAAKRGDRTEGRPPEIRNRGAVRLFVR
jgi:hypothetical protein